MYYRYMSKQRWILSSSIIWHGKCIEKFCDDKQKLRQKFRFWMADASYQL